MSKSKQQKQEEAIERKRKSLSKVRTEWFARQPGGEIYNQNLKWGKEHADKVALDYTRVFEKAAKEAHCDTHGNPLDANGRIVQKTKPIAKFIQPQRDKSWSYQVVYPERGKLPESWEFVAAMTIPEVKAAHPFLQGHNGNWAMVEFWVKDEEVALKAARKLAEQFEVELGRGDFTREELGLG